MDFFNPKKTLGQHFLKDLKIADKIVHSLNRDKKDLIIEIGCFSQPIGKFIIDL